MVGVASAIEVALGNYGLAIRAKMLVHRRPPSASPEDAAFLPRAGILGLAREAENNWRRDQRKEEAYRFSRGKMRTGPLSENPLGDSYLWLHLLLLERVEDIMSLGADLSTCS